MSNRIKTFLASSKYIAPMKKFSSLLRLCKLELWIRQHEKKSLLKSFYTITTYSRKHLVINTSALSIHIEVIKVNNKIVL